MVHNKPESELGDHENGYSTESCDENISNKIGYGLTESCNHAIKSCDINKIRKSIKTSGILRNCPQCDNNITTNVDNELEVAMEYDESLWICLKCGAQLCGRMKNKHALAHNQKTHSDEHNLAVNSTYWAVWCYKCDSAVNPSSKKKLQECIDYIRKEAKRNVIEQKGEKEDTVSDNSIILETHSSILAKENSSNKTCVNVDTLPRVRGLSNLGNTCFFNAVLQCLSQTPFLLEILKESSEPGEKFQLPGGKMKMENGEEVFLKPINGELNSWGNLTAELADTLEQLQSGKNCGVFTPNKLLKQLTTKWPQFAGGDQHDSHELLRHLLESVRCEDLRRYQSVILKLLGYSSKSDPQTVEEGTKQKIKFYGQQVSDRILRPEQIFRGFLVSTLTCQDCFHTSSRHEYFLDISLPITIEKPHPPRRKPSPEPVVSKHQTKKEKERERRAKRNLKKQAEKENLQLKSQTSSSSGEQTDGDIEDNLLDDTQAKPIQNSDIYNSETMCDNNGNAENSSDIVSTLNDKSSNSVKNEIIELGISSTGVNNLIKQSSKTDTALCEPMQNLDLVDDVKSRQKKTKRIRTYSSADWSTTLAPRYQCEDGECSVQSCLNNFTWVELMTGNNKVTCDNCSEIINGKGGKPVHTNATKQLLISSPPAVLILHLKRFQVGPRAMFRKITKHVAFPFVLDIAPFCGSKVKKFANLRPHQKNLPYSLYGIVEHSGTMHGGHYVAYVKIRPKIASSDRRWKFLPTGTKAELDQSDELKLRLEKSIKRAREFAEANESSSSSEDGAMGGENEALPDPLPGKWYYVSDSRVQGVSEKEVLNAQAYLLFYERIDIDYVDNDD
ncbi:ubiquitin carboxyl-terminal hydrolase 16/45 [Culicoides brevitarsis]|uniref:ubiquitin carboxyl-terminal hydrolase 16/45 n=1 Tax=Culicoides brevitarsis TaxID=469753 RepID=UPI00307C7DBA